MGTRRTTRFSSGHKIALRPRPIPHSKTIDVFNDRSYLRLAQIKDILTEIDVSDFEHLLDCQTSKVTKTWPLTVAFQDPN